MNKIEQASQYMSQAPEGMDQEEWEKKHAENLSLEKDYSADQIETINKSRDAGGMNAEKAHAEARAVQARHGDRIALYDVRKTLAEAEGDQDEIAKLQQGKEAYIEQSADQERKTVNTLLKSAREKMPGLNPVNVSKEVSLRDSLSRLEPITEEVRMGPLEMQHLAGRLNTEVQTIIEPNPSANEPDRIMTYEVVPMGKAGKDNIYLTWGDGARFDSKPRLFALSDSAIEDAGLRIEKGADMRSIYPSAEQTRTE